MKCVKWCIPPPSSISRKRGHCVLTRYEGRHCWWGWRHERLKFWESAKSNASVVACHLLGYCNERIILLSPLSPIFQGWGKLVYHPIGPFPNGFSQFPLLSKTSNVHKLGCHFVDLHPNGYLCLSLNIQKCTNFLSFTHYYQSGMNSIYTFSSRVHCCIFLWFFLTILSTSSFYQFFIHFYLWKEDYHCWRIYKESLIIISMNK